MYVLKALAIMTWKDTSQSPISNLHKELLSPKSVYYYDSVCHGQLIICKATNSWVAKFYRQQVSVIKAPLLACSSKPADSNNFIAAWQLVLKSLLTLFHPFNKNAHKSKDLFSHCIPEWLVLLLHDDKTVVSASNSECSGSVSSLKDFNAKVRSGSTECLNLSVKPSAPKRCSVLLRGAKSECS